MLQELKGLDEFHMYWGGVQRSGQKREGRGRRWTQKKRWLEGVKIKIMFKKGEQQHHEEKEMKGGQGKKGLIFILVNDVLDFYKRAMKQ